VLVGGFTLVLVWQVFFETVANIHKFENLCEFLSVALNSLIITWSVYSLAYLALIAVVLIRAVAYVLIRVRYFRGFTKLRIHKIGQRFTRVPYPVPYADSFANWTVGVLLHNRWGNAYPLNPCPSHY
jgi:hypothetical protein